MLRIVILMAMVLILDGNSEIGAHKANFLHFICIRHLIRSRAVANRNFFSPKRPIFLHACAICSMLPSNISTVLFWLFTRTLQFLTNLLQTFQYFDNCSKIFYSFAFHPDSLSLSYICIHI